MLIELWSPWLQDNRPKQGASQKRKQGMGEQKSAGITAPNPSIRDRS
jgi:hypothetical protein